MRIIPRREWGARPAKSVTPQRPDRLRGIVVHWFGSPTSKKRHKDCPRQLQAVQRTHMMNKDEGYVDIAYNFAVCPHGAVYELRGWNRRSGANGTSQANKEFLAIVVMAGTGDPFPIEARVSLRQLIWRAWDVKKVGKIVKRHGSITGSSCPGPIIGKWVNDKRYLVGRGSV